MIHKSMKWTVMSSWGEVYDRSFKEQQPVYITNENDLNPHQMEHIKRLDGYTGRFAGVASGQFFGSGVVGSGGAWVISSTDSTIALSHNVGLLSIGGLLTLISGTFLYHAVKQAKKAYNESRAKHAKLPASAKAFAVGGIQWDKLHQALEMIEAEDIAKTTAIAEAKTKKLLPGSGTRSPSVVRKIGVRFGERARATRQRLETYVYEENWDDIEYDTEMPDQPSRDLVSWYIFMNALEEHSELGRTCDMYMSEYLLRTEDLITQMTRPDQTERMREKLDETLSKVAYAQMEHMYAYLSQTRDLEGFELGERATMDEYKTLRTRGEATLAAEMALITADPLTNSFQKQL